MRAIYLDIDGHEFAVPADPPSREVKQMRKNLRAAGLLARVLVVPVLAVVPVVATAASADASSHVMDGGVRGVR